MWQLPAFKIFSLLSMLASIALSLPPTAFAQAPTRIVTGKNLEKALAESVSCSAVRVPLIRQLEDIRQPSGICIVRDRRIDPNTPLSLQTSFIPRRTLLVQLAALQPNSATAFTSEYAYIAPTTAAHRLPLLLQLAEQQSAPWKKLPPSVSRQALLPTRITWQRPAVPSEILSTAARNAAVTIRNPEQLPHDVWDSAELPPVPFIELACLLLNQFDLYPLASEDRLEITLVPIPATEPMELRHSFPPELRSTLEEHWNTQNPTIPIRWTRTSAVFTAPLPTHCDFAGFIELSRSSPQTATANRPPADSLKTRQFQLQAERAPLGAVVATLRASGVTVEIADENSPAVQKLLQTIVPISPKPLRGDEFFSKLFGPHFSTVTVSHDKLTLQK
jgi:hypothetical protein